MLMLHKNNENIEATCLCEITTLKFRQINNSHRKFALHTQRQTNNNPQVQFIHKDIYTYIEQSTGTVYTQTHSNPQVQCIHKDMRRHNLHNLCMNTHRKNLTNSSFFFLSPPPRTTERSSGSRCFLMYSMSFNRSSSWMI